MRGVLLIVPLLGWTGLVSCEDKQQIEGLVRTVLPDPAATLSCREPQAWFGEGDWICTAELRGERSCYQVRDRSEVPHQVACPRGPRHKAAVELP